MNHDLTDPKENERQSVTPGRCCVVAYAGGVLGKGEVSMYSTVGSVHFELFVVQNALSNTLVLSECQSRVQSIPAIPSNGREGPFR